MHTGIAHRTWSYVMTNIFDIVFKSILFGEYRYITSESKLARSRIFEDLYIGDAIPGMKEVK